MRLETGELVIVDENSHLHKGVESCLEEVIGCIKSSDSHDKISKIVNCGKTIGKDGLIRTNPEDEIIFAQRKGRAGLSRFVKNREPEDCGSVQVVLTEITSGEWYLKTAFIGSIPAPPEPWDTEAFRYDAEHSFRFWNAYALAWGLQEIIFGTETKKYPW